MVNGVGGAGWSLARHMGHVGDRLEDSHIDKHEMWKEWAHGVVVKGSQIFTAEAGSWGGGGWHGKWSIPRMVK